LLQYVYTIVNVQSFSSHTAHSTDLHFFSPWPDTGLWRSWMGLVHHVVCLFTFQLLLVPIAFTHGGWLGFVDLGGWLHILRWF